LAAASVAVSAVNIAGGFKVTARMLDMFRRPTDPTEYNYLYGIPGVVSLGALLAAHSAGVPNIYACGYLLSSICCIGGIAGLAS